MEYWKKPFGVALNQAGKIVAFSIYLVNKFSWILLFCCCKHNLSSSISWIYWRPLCSGIIWDIKDTLNNDTIISLISRLKGLQTNHKKSNKEIVSDKRFTKHNAHISYIWCLIVQKGSKQTSLDEVIWPHGILFLWRYPFHIIRSVI